MEQQIKHRGGLSTLMQCAMVCALWACDDEQVAVSRAALTAECESSDEIPEDAWVCPADRTLECGADDVVFVANDESTSCEGEDVVLSDDGPFAPGTHTITVSDEDGELLCTAELTVVDTEPPVLESHTVDLWPPNHKLHEISVEDCVSVNDQCDGDVDAEFVWASSDEPIDALGDGHHAPDIGISADGEHVCVRSERQGPEDGRVYKLGVHVVDAAGNEADGECTIIVDHDQRGVVGSDSGEAYRIVFDDDSESLAGCGGESPPPPPPDAGTPLDAGEPLEDAGAPPPVEAPE